MGSGQGIATQAPTGVTRIETDSGRQRVVSGARRREDDGAARLNELKRRAWMPSGPIVPIGMVCSHARCTISSVIRCTRLMSQR